MAVSDATGVLASPRAVVTRTGDDDTDRAAIAALVREEGAGLVVVGLPVSLDGRQREPATAARAEAEALATLLGIPVELQDERLTTVLATRLRRAATGAGEGRARPRRGSSRSSRRPVDAEAAAVMLQAYLDARRGAPG